MSSIVPNTSSALELSVISRLNETVPDLCVEAFPDDPDGYRLNHPVGAVLVRYHGSKFSQPIDAGVLAQERVMAFEVTLVMRQLSGNEGIYCTLERVRQGLAGFSPPAFTKIRPMGEEFVSQGGGEWRYAIDFTSSTLVVELEEPIGDSVVTQITFLDKDKHEKVCVPRGS